MEINWAALYDEYLYNYTLVKGGQHPELTHVKFLWAEDLSDDQIEELRSNFDMSLQDPDYTTVTNFPITFTEVATPSYDRRDTAQLLALAFAQMSAMDAKAELLYFDSFRTNMQVYLDRLPPEPEEELSAQD
jgi:hypothetical protein